MKKRLILAAILLLLVAALATSALAAESEGEWQTAQSDEIFQEGGFPRARESVPATFSAGTTDLAGAKAAMVAGMESLSAEIDLSSYNIPNSELRTLYTNAVNENPQLFFVDNCYEYSTYGQTVYRFTPKYKYDDYGDAEAIKAKQAALEAKVTEILEPVEEDWTELEKIVYLHDYLAANYEYDLTYSVYDAYGLLVGGKGVCQAYTLAYRLLLSRVGVESGTVTSKSINHIWNLVKIDETWYHVDVTWDDPTKDKFGQVRHTNFLLSETGMIAKKSSKSTYEYDWVYSEGLAPEDTTDTTYESCYWKDVTSPIVPLDGTWYYLLWENRENKIMATTNVADAGTKKTDYGASWYVWNGGLSYWMGCYSGLDVYDGKLVFNDPERVYSYDPKTGTKTTLYTLTEEEAATGYIYGSRVDGSTLKYALSQTPNESGTVKECSLIVYIKVEAGGYSYCLDGKKTLSVRKTTSEGSVMVAWYDKNGRMLSISLITTSGESDELKAPTGAASLRLMAANGEWKPLAVAVELALNSGT